MRVRAAPLPIKNRLSVPDAGGDRFIDHQDLVIMRLTFIRLALNGVFSIHRTAAFIHDDLACPGQRTYPNCG